MDADSVARFASALGSTLLWTLISVLLALGVFWVIDRRYGLAKEIFEENSIAAGILAASFVLGVFYTVATIVTD